MSRSVNREAVERGARAYEHRRATTNAPASLARAVLEAAAPTLLAASEERDRYRAALDALADAARTFSTEAAYGVRLDVEEEFVAALDDAERLLSNDR